MNAVMRILAICSMLIAASACVHRQFELPMKADVTLELEYLDIDMPLHTSIELSNNATSRADDAPRCRHIIKVYDASYNEVASEVMTGDAINATSPHSHKLSLAPGSYTAACWTDYATDGEADWHYDTSDFPTVELRYTDAQGSTKVHNGSTPWRDAFCGSATFRIADDGSMAPTEKTPIIEGTSVKVEMRRPMGHFSFVATDFEEFATKYKIKTSSDGDKSNPMPGYSVTFHYSEYMPSVYSALTDAPMDSRVGASFAGHPRNLSVSGGNIELGSDFVFCPSLVTSVIVAVEIHSEESGNTVARAGPFTIPLLKNHRTVVSGNFLTSNSQSGVVIDPDFDGEYNIPI